MTTLSNPADDPSSEFINRMIGDMKIRHLAPATIECYSRHVRFFALFLDKSLDLATPEDIRNFQLHLIQVRKLAFSGFNQAVCSLRFLYHVTLPRPWAVTMIPFGKKAKRLPSVLSREEVDRLITCTHNRKHRTILMTLYATGLRISEALNLKIADIDSQRMQLKVTRGKGNRTKLYDLLFSAAWLALKQTIEAEQGFDPAALMVLHTWNQKLEAHAHVHAVVPGGGPALNGGQWKEATEPERRASGCYLVDAVALRQSFREHYINGLRRLFSKEQLKLEGEFAYLQQPEQQQQLLAELEAVQWVSYIEPPPHEDCGPEQVLKYLARYLTGGPISEARIVRADDRQVTFMAREGKVTGGQRQQVPITLTTLEFTRRWALHILPKGYTKARRFGGWSNRRTSEYIERCALLLDGASVKLTPQAMLFDPQQWELELESQTELAQAECPHCGAPMQCIAASPKPSWQDIMNSPHRPSWYTRGRLKL